MADKGNALMAIKEFFGCTMKEIKALSKEDRAELGRLCLAAKGEAA